MEQNITKNTLQPRIQTHKHTNTQTKSFAIMPTNWNTIMQTINIIKQYKEHSHIYIGNKPQTLFYWT